MLNKTIKKQGGFTLLELLIVIVIIAILAALIIPNLTSAPKKANDTRRKTDLKAVQKSLEEYFVSNNIYPNTLNDLTTSTPPLMKTVPTDPKNSGVYVYTYTPANTNTTYTLHGCLENGSDGVQNSVIADTTCTSSRGVQLSNLSN